MRPRRNFSKVFLLATIMITPSACLFAQLDSTGFPLHVGNRWFYRYETILNGLVTALHVRVKQIVDTTLSGDRIVRVSRLGADTTLSTEHWSVIGGNLYVGTYLLYDSTLTRDTTWTITGGGLTDRYTLLLRRVVLFGFNQPCQIRQHFSSFTSTSGLVDRRTALGVGWYYDYQESAALQQNWSAFYSLIGFEENGAVFGDTVLTSVDPGGPFWPPSLKLNQNYPNPFNPSTTIEYSTEESGWVEIIVRDLLGRSVATLIADAQSAGPHRVHWTPTNVSSGVYIYTLRNRAQSISKKLVYVK